MLDQHNARSIGMERLSTNGQRRRKNMLTVKYHCRLRFRLNCPTERLKVYVPLAVSMSIWNGGILSKIIVKANYDAPYKLRIKTPVKILVNGREIAKSSTVENLTEFNATAGTVYFIISLNPRI
jgi:hypothetical protein